MLAIGSALVSSPPPTFLTSHFKQSTYPLPSIMKKWDNHGMRWDTSESFYLEPCVWPGVTCSKYLLLSAKCHKYSLVSTNSFMEGHNSFNDQNIAADNFSCSHTQTTHTHKHFTIFYFMKGWTLKSWTILTLNLKLGQTFYPNLLRIKLQWQRG